MFRTFDGRVSLTFDTWTSTFVKPFLGVNIHWIDDDWFLQNRIICFEAMEESHNGFNIKTPYTKAMDFWKEHPSIHMELGGSLMHTDGRFITNDNWSLAKIIHDVLETFDNATHIFSYVYEPNIHMVILECIKIICSIKQTSQANPDPSVKNVLDNMKMLILMFLIILCDDYGVVIQPDPIRSSKGKSRFEFPGPVLKKQRPNSSSSSPTSSSNVGIDEYLSYQFETEEDFHIIQWWKNHSYKFSFLTRITKDILAILASTIASESAFSAGRRVLDEKRSHLCSKTIE
ncbi:putative AC transposase, partial [Bienertia sinuspersici]